MKGPQLKLRPFLLLAKPRGVGSGHGDNNIEHICGNFYFYEAGR